MVAGHVTVSTNRQPPTNNTGCYKAEGHPKTSPFGNCSPLQATGDIDASKYRDIMVNVLHRNESRLRLLMLYRYR